MAVLITLLSLFVTLLTFGGFVYRRISGRCSSKKRMDGVTVIITGASAGIGEATALDLAGRGARVILGCRNERKAQKVADKIKADTGNQEVLVEKLDLSDLDSVRSFAHRIKGTEKSVKILINNAGAGIRTKQLNPQNLELTMATNHYGHFLLTNLLLDLLKSSSPSRIINVSSRVHTLIEKLDCDDLNFTNQEYVIATAYSQSKLCNILFNKELSQKLQGSGVTANSLHPGLVATEGFHKVGTTKAYLYSALAYILGKDCMTGAQTTIYLAVSDEVEGVSGKYFVDCKESVCSELAQNDELAKRLWEVSERDVHLMPTEKFY